TAVALCATDVTVPTSVASATVVNNPGGTQQFPGGASTTATVPCPSGTALLAGGSHVVSAQNGNPGGPGNGGQGVHPIGDSPSDGSGTATANGSSPSAWTALAQNGGQNIDFLNVTAFALCAAPAAAPSVDVSITKTGPSGALVGDNVTYTITVQNSGP